MFYHSYLFPYSIFRLSSMPRTLTTWRMWNILKLREATHSWKVTEDGKASLYHC